MGQCYSTWVWKRAWKRFPGQYGDPSPNSKNIWEVQTIFITAVNQLPSWCCKNSESLPGQSYPLTWNLILVPNKTLRSSSLWTQIPGVLGFAEVARNNKYTSSWAVAERHSPLSLLWLYMLASGCTRWLVQILLMSFAKLSSGSWVWGL